MVNWIILFCSFLAISFLHSPVHGSCIIENRQDGCTYTVFCNTHAGSVNNPGCNSNPDVTFILNNADVFSLTTGFFSSTNFDSRVRRLRFTNNNWKLLEAQAIRYFRYSTFVDLSRNGIENLNNFALQDLTLMKHLNLSNNMIEQLYSKSLYVSDSTSGALEILDLSNNRLTSLDSKVFANLDNLLELYLQNNLLKLLSDSCFDSLVDLKTLILRNNRIPSINMTFVPLSELSYLDLSHNAINKLLGFEMIRLVSLAYLNISYNNIETIENICFSQAFKLQILDLSKNQIRSSLDKAMFEHSAKLLYLDLNGNNITTYGDFVFQHNSLIFLNIENNHFTGGITNATFGGLQNVTKLNITHQHIEAIYDNAFSNMINLKFLNLSYNFIKTIENSSFVNASSLTILDLSHNQITNLNFLQLFASNLTEMYMKDNKILMVTQNLFQNHNRLKIIDISENMILKIEHNSLPLGSLQYLGVNNNNLSGVIVSNVFSPARFLRYLDLSNFHLQKLNDSAIINMTLVARVNISHNDLEYIHPNNFKDVDKMFSLDLSYNNLTSINIDTQLNNLKAIYLNNNKFSGIPNIFGNESKLEYLDISCNNITNVADATFKNISHITVLHMSKNNVSCFNNEYTNSLVNLIELSLASNQIKEMINMSYFKTLQSVNLSNNEIAFVNSSQFENMHSLQLLSLSGNRIKVLEPGTFQHLKSLILLDISSNYITNIRFGSFRGLNSTSIINLSENNLKSINVEVFHECSVLKTLILDYNFIEKINIESVATAAPKLEMLSIGGNPIACEEIVRSKRISTASVKQITITSLHKIYHEDNVHGIKCGDSVANDTIESTTSKVTESIDFISGKSSSTILFVWCGVLSVILVIGILAIYTLKSRGKRMNINRESRMQFQNSGEIVNSECYNDLLN